jgi:hypothetical protein
MSENSSYVAGYRRPLYISKKSREEEKKTKRKEEQK